MRYFYDTEFSQTPTGYDLISIGIVADDGREYEATSAEMDLATVQSDPFLSANVLPHLPPRTEWKPRSVIAAEVREFLTADGGYPELWAWFASWDHTCLARLYGKIPSPPWLPDLTHDLASIAAFVDPKPDVAALPIRRGSVHSALGDARLTRETFELLRTQHRWAQHADGLLPR